MGRHHVFTVVGGVLMVIGLFLGRTYYVYPGDAWRTIRELLPTLSCLLLGCVVTAVGTRMGDGQ